MNHDGLFAIDFHVHTSRSFDCLTPPRLVVEIARRRGLDGIAIVDHDTIEGAKIAMSVNDDPNFLIIPGVEVKSDRGDIIGLYLREDIVSRKFPDVIAEIHAQGGIAYLPHPVRTFGAENLARLHADHPDIDLWELYNGRYGTREFAQAKQTFDSMGIRGTLCGSDAHFPWEIGVFRTMLAGMPRDPKALMELSTRAVLRANVRSKFALRAGIRLGEVTKTAKRRQYGKLARLVASVPWKLVKASVSFALRSNRMK
ncbi:MAG: PHP domain-containing protein [Candidatus Eremiobacteraeota bacterium]|nr:PHP domain-containing protein [Candidatus Eremiobacteraeota bacterium]